jgi:hypothetical protein
MNSITAASALDFVARAELPPIRRTRSSEADAGESEPVLFATEKNQATVVGSSIVSFATGVPAAQREAISNSTLLAQLLAKRKVTDPRRMDEWYDAYFDVLTNIGWVLQDKSLSEYRESSTDFESHKAIMAVATTLLGPAPAALALVKTTVDAIQSMDSRTPWLTIFSRESQSARAARFQIGLAEQDASGQTFVSLMAFSLDARATITQLLFFKAKASDVTLRHCSGRVTINTAILETAHTAIKDRLKSHVSDYVRALPELD